MRPPFLLFFSLIFSVLPSGMLFAQTGVKFNMVKNAGLDTETAYYWVGQADMPARTPWRLERALDAGRASGQTGGWFPMATGFGGTYSAPLGQIQPGEEYSFLSPLSPSGVGREAFEAVLLTLPTASLPPAGNEVGFVRGASYQSAHVSLRRWAANGTVVAQWKSLASPGTTVVTAVFPVAQMDIGKPGDPGRYPFGVGCVTGPPTDAVPLFVSFSAYDLALNPSTFTSTGGLGTGDTAVREFLKNHQTEVRAELWPPEGLGEAPPPSPVTLAQRSFYRLRTESAPPLNGFDVPTAIAANSDVSPTSSRRLRISEVSYFRTVTEESQYVAGEASDWVEIWNSSSSALSTANYYLSDSPTNRDKFQLPARTLNPGQFLVIHCTSEGRARLNWPDPLLETTAGFNLKVGDTVYLHYKNGSAWSTPSQMPPAGTVVPPAGSVSPPGPFPDRVPANISYGIRQSAAGTIGYGWFASPTQGALNSEALLDPGASGPAVVCGEPLVEDAASPVSAPVALKGKFFSSGSMSVRLRGANAADTLLYTLNGREPTPQSAVYDPAKPLTVNGTTVLKVKAVRAGVLPSATVARTFIHTPTVATLMNPLAEARPLCDPIIASTFADAAGALAGYASAGGITAQLTARPAIAVSFNNGAVDPVPAPPGSGIMDDQPVTVEFIDPANAAAYSQEGALMRRSGNHSTGLLTKHSWHLLFKKSITRQGTDRWQPPTTSSVGVTTSVLFPPVAGERANPVTTFSRLQLRGGSGDAYSDDLGGADAKSTYLKDWWLRENQRSQGGWTPRCRQVSLFLNGFYWGVFNLGERPDSDCVSDWLCSEPGLTVAQKADRAPDKIQFLRYDGYTPSTVTDTLAGSLWQFVINSAKACYTAPITTTGTTGASTATITAWSTLTGVLDMRDYIDYMITLHLCGKDDHRNDQFAGWRHPVDGKWHLLQWDGDGVAFTPPNLLSYTGAGPENWGDAVGYLAPENAIPAIEAEQLAAEPDGETATVLLDTLPHEYLKFCTQYRTAFDQRLRELMLTAPASSPPPGAGAFTETKILARFDWMAGDVRRTLEAEMMRWGKRIEDAYDLHTFASDPAPLRADWADLITDIRFNGINNSFSSTRLALARPNLKTAARWAFLLNDIPPAIITWNSTTQTVTATRGGSRGHVYISHGASQGDPVYEYSNPTYSTVDPSSVAQGGIGSNEFVTVRVYAPDIDNQLAWSAMTIFKTP